MKKILTMIMVLGCSMIVLTGCGKDNETPNNENNNNNQQEQQGGNQQQGMDLEIKSTDNKLVFVDSTGISYSIFYFENDKIVKYQSATKYPSAELAKAIYDSANEEEKGVKVTVEGNYVLVEQDAAEYDNLTKSKLEEALEIAGYKISK